MKLGIHHEKHVMSKPNYGNGYYSNSILV